MSASSQTTSAERLAELLDVKVFPPPADFAARAKMTDPGIYEQLLRDIADGRELGDVTTLGDPSVVTTLQKTAADASE
jgi:hypothetical protein